MQAQYTVVRLTDRDVIRAFLNRDRVRTAYAIGDLDDTLWPDSEFVGATDATGELVAVLLLYHGLDPVVLTAFGPPDAVRAIVLAHDMPREIYYLWLPELGKLLAEAYDVPNQHREWRMVLEPDAFQAPVLDGVAPIEPEQADVLAALFQHAAEPGEEVVAFSPAQIAQGAFFGVWVDGRLVATAGTHVWSVQERVTAIGNVFTRPDYRGRGYGTLCTAAVVAAALRAGMDTIILNVKQDNAPAIRVYEKLGFRTHCVFLEGPGLRRAE
ncbi:MAG: GNAT family N-acetyltransferase [Chloroflexi bacterium]|nr:GNAT family N-acetyltransferase [Chloroflexota bacterium]